MADKGRDEKSHSLHLQPKGPPYGDFVLEKSIFSNIFDKDIKRVFIYKKAERLAKAIHLIAPAFALSAPLRTRIDAAAIGLIDAAILPPGRSREALSRELLALSSVLGIAQTSGLLSAMNAELIAREAHLLLQDIALYEEPRVTLDLGPTLADLSRRAGKEVADMERQANTKKRGEPRPARNSQGHKGHNPESSRTSSRRDAILAVLRNKGTAYIKDISSVIREVSEKTIQRELQSMVLEGIVAKQGERRWTLYSLVGS